LVSRNALAGLSLTDYARLGLSKSGLHTTISIRYPGIERRPFKVRFNNVWRQIENGTWEAKQIAKVIRFSRPGQTLVDLGAWVGPYSLLFAHLVSPSGIVYAFEPDPVAREELIFNLKINNLQNVKVIPKCVGDYDGLAILKSNRPGNSVSSISRYGDEKVKWSETVDIVTLDSYFSSRQAIHGIKIDVEGSELEVLIGARKLLRQFRPWVLCEYEGQYQKDLAGQLKMLAQIKSELGECEEIDIEPNGKTILFAGN